MSKKDNKKVAKATNQDSKKKRRKILLGILIPLGVAAVGAGTYFGIKLSKNPTVKEGVELDESVSQQGVKVESSDIKQGEESTFTLTLPDANKRIEGITMNIGDLTITESTEGVTIVKGKIVISAELMQAGKLVIVQTITLEDAWYNIDETNGLITMTDVGKSTTGIIIIPEKVDGVVVKGVDKDGCKGSKASQIGFNNPENITTISAGAFSDTKDLTTAITIPKNVKEIGESAFENSTLTGLYFNYECQVTIIKDKAFYNCKNLTAITIPTSVKAIGKQVFVNSDLKDLYFNDYDAKWIQSGDTNNVLLNITSSENNATFLQKIAEGILGYNWGSTGIEISDKAVKTAYLTYDKDSFSNSCITLQDGCSATIDDTSKTISINYSVYSPMKGNVLVKNSDGETIFEEEDVKFTKDGQKVEITIDDEIWKEIVAQQELTISIYTDLDKFLDAYKGIYATYMAEVAAGKGYFEEDVGAYVSGKFTYQGVDWTLTAINKKGNFFYATYKNASSDEKEINLSLTNTADELRDDIKNKISSYGYTFAFDYSEPASSISYTYSDGSSTFKESFNYKGYRTETVAVINGESVSVTNVFNRSPHIEVGKLVYTPITGTETCSVKSRGVYQGETEVKVPETATISGTTYKVVEVEENAFKGQAEITKVTLPSTLTKIGANAFNGCTNLANVVFTNKMKPWNLADNNYYQPYSSTDAADKLKASTTAWTLKTVSDLYFIGSVGATTWQLMPMTKVDGYNNRFKYEFIAQTSQTSGQFKFYFENDVNKSYIYDLPEYIKESDPHLSSSFVAGADVIINNLTVGNKYTIYVDIDEHQIWSEDTIVELTQPKVVYTDGSTFDVSTGTFKDPWTGSSVNLNVSMCKIDGVQATAETTISEGYHDVLVTYTTANGTAYYSYVILGTVATPDKTCTVTFNNDESYEQYEGIVVCDSVTKGETWKVDIQLDGEHAYANEYCWWINNAWCTEHFNQATASDEFDTDNVISIYWTDGTQYIVEKCEASVDGVTIPKKMWDKTTGHYYLEFKIKETKVNPRGTYDYKGIGFGCIL